MLIIIMLGIIAFSVFFIIGKRMAEKRQYKQSTMVDPFTNERYFINER